MAEMASRDSSIPNQSRAKMEQDMVRSGQALPPATAFVQKAL
jgi:hypothetical protein